MRLNLILMLTIGALAYSITLYMDSRKPSAQTITLQPDTAITTLTTQEIAPNFTFTPQNGTKHTLKEFNGKIILLNFWASWCPPCIKEFPHLIKAAKNNPKDIVLIALSSDIDEDSMNKFIQKLDLGEETNNIFIALDKNQTITQSLFKTFKLPETLIIDQSQIMRAKIIGANWSDEDLDKHIRLLINDI